MGSHNILSLYRSGPLVVRRRMTILSFVRNFADAGVKCITYITVFILTAAIFNANFAQLTIWCKQKYRLLADHSIFNSAPQRDLPVILKLSCIIVSIQQLRLKVENSWHCSKKDSTRNKNITEVMQMVWIIIYNI